MSMNWGDLIQREQQVARHLARGLSHREIAREMNVREQMIDVVVYRLYEKVGVKSRMSFVVWMASQT
jgi:DNA-binding NarL/FixJ family response regulator